MTPRFTILEEKIIKSFGIVFGETLLPFLRFLSICSTSYFRFGQAVNHPIFTISNYIFNYVHHFPSNKSSLFSNDSIHEYTIIFFILKISSADKRIWWHCAISIHTSIDNLILMMQYNGSKVIESKEKKRMIESELRRIDLVVVREENSSRDKTHYCRFRPRNVVERCVTRRCVIRRLSCALSNEFRLERSGSNVKSRMWRR